MTAAAAVIDVDTPVGPGRLLVTRAAHPVADLLLGHGAGGGVDAMDLALLARTLPALGITVARFEQPWRTAGRHVAGPARQLDLGWRAAVQRLLERPDSTDRLFVGGRSTGARVACRTAGEAVAGIVCLGFPLHPPGRPDRSRLAELLLPSAPRLVLQGTSDAFGGADELRSAVAESTGVLVLELASTGVRVVALPGADHGFRTRARADFSAAELRVTVVTSVATFVLGSAPEGWDGNKPNPDLL